MTSVVTIGLIQPLRLVRAVLGRWLNAQEDGNITVTIEADDVRDYLRCVKGLEKANLPKLVLLDVDQSKQEIIGMISRLKTATSGLKIFLLATVKEDEEILEFLRAGADGYCPKDIEPEQLLEGIMTTVNKGYCYPDRIIGLLIGNFRATRPIPPDKPGFLVEEKGLSDVYLSHKEHEVFKLLISEMTYKEMAEKLQISLRTVNVHVHNLCKKFNVGSRMGLVGLAVKYNLFMPRSVN